MDKSRKLSLPETDYLAILDVITHFYKCETQPDLQSVFQNHLFPLLGAHAAFYAWRDPEISSTPVIESINIPEKILLALKESIEFSPAAKTIPAFIRPVIASDLDLPKSEFLKQAEEMFFKKRSRNRKGVDYFLTANHAMMTFDLPEATLGVSIFRESSENNPWTWRNLRVFELLRPHILQAIKTIVITEEVVKYKSVAKFLADSPVPIALVTQDIRAHFYNQAFENLFPILPERTLSDDLTNVLKSAISKTKLEEYSASLVPLPFYETEEETFRINLTRLGKKYFDEYDLWFVRFKPVVEQLSKMYLLMQSSRLSRREMEIATLVCDGMTDKEISSRLFLSVHTIKAHLKSIHKKLYVSNRAQLVACLQMSKSRV